MSQSRESDYATSDQSENSQKLSFSKKRFWSADQSLIATLALAVISLCALFVSIYQTRVLSMQQEVMAEQQRIMTESARAQLWPNVAVSTSVSYNSDSLTALRFNISNTGTGPAIIENVTVQYQEEYIRSWEDMATVDTLLPLQGHGRLSTSGISNRVIQAGEMFSFVEIENSPKLLAYLNTVLIDNGSLKITVCYKSVFDEYWTIKDQLGSGITTERIQTDDCQSVDSLSFTQ